MAIENRNLPVGTRIWANYKKTRYVCTVEAGEDEGVVFALEDGTKHKSPSAAGSKVMGGNAVNGWRFWTIEGDEPEASAEEKPAKKGRSAKAKKQAKTIFKAPGQDGTAKDKTRWFCSACMKGFEAEGDSQPEQCPEGHSNSDAELNAPSGVEAETEAQAAT